MSHVVVNINKYDLGTILVNLGAHFATFCDLFGSPFGTLLGPFWGHKMGPGAVSNTRLALKEFVEQIWPPLSLILAPLGAILGAFVSSGWPFWFPFGSLFATQNSSGCCLRFWVPFCVPFAHFLGTPLAHRCVVD